MRGKSEMRVVSENSDDDLKRRRVDEELGYAIRALTANLLRVTRGAGKPFEIGLQAQRVVDAVVAYYEAWRRNPGPEQYAKYLDIGLDREILARVSEEERYRSYAEEAMVRAALQISASRLVGQLTQERVAEHHLYEAIRDLDEVRKMQRKRMAAEAKAAQGATKLIRRKRKAKTSKTVTQAD
jgi:hypothetical protein